MNVNTKVDLSEVKNGLNEIKSILESSLNVTELFFAYNFSSQTVTFDGSKSKMYVIGYVRYYGNIKALTPTSTDNNFSVAQISNHLLQAGSSANGTVDTRILLLEINADSITNLTFGNGGDTTIVMIIG